MVEIRAELKFDFDVRLYTEPKMNSFAAFSGESEGGSDWPKGKSLAACTC